jgi:hypothetical protein
MHIFVLQISEAMVNNLPACANDDSAWHDSRIGHQFCMFM